MAVVRWTFVDPVTTDEYEFEINPNEGGTPGREKGISYVNTAAPDGRVIMFEGREKQREGQFSGTLLTQEHYEALDEWYDKRYQVYMTDDLGRSFTIYITKFTATRVRSQQHPWKHTYQVSYVIVDWD